MMTFATEGGTIFTVNGDQVTITPYHREWGYIVSIKDVREFLIKLDQDLPFAGREHLRPGIPEAHR